MLTIVIPAYNEVRRLGDTLDRIAEFTGGRDQAVEVIVVDDGSTDATAGLIRSRRRGEINLQLLVNAENRGKGFSVARGMLEARGDPILMCDADLSCPIEELDKLTRRLESGYDVVIGSRDLSDSVLDPPQPVARRLMAAAFRMLRRRILLRNIRDTQCGFKLFRREAARAVFARLTTDGWMFDCEALALAERLGYRIAEVGIRWCDNRDTRVAVWPEISRALPTLLRIRRRDQVHRVRSHSNDES